MRSAQTAPDVQLPRARTAITLAGALMLIAAGAPLQAAYIDPADIIETQLMSFGPIQGNAFLPLNNAANTSTEAGAPAAVDGYGWVLSNIAISLSSQRAVSPGPATMGQAHLSVPWFVPPPGEGGEVCREGGSAGNVNNGDPVCVNSYFDVFFDVTVTDIDATTGFFSGLPNPLVEADNGPMRLDQIGTNLCVADTSKPNLGCLPVVGDAYIGHFKIVLDLPDINGNGDPDQVRFTFVQHQVGDVTNTFVEGASVYDTFNSTIDGDGEVSDSITDPPFSFTLEGPTTARQNIFFPAPAPATAALIAAGLGLIGLRRRRDSGQPASR